MEFEKSSSRQFQLRPFSPGPARPDLHVSGSAARRPGTLLITYILAGDLSGIALPEPAPAVRRHELWRRTCFEVFFGMPGQAAYWEANFSPHGDWNVYRFTDYRQGMAEEERIDPPVCRLTADPRRLELSCRLDIRRICPDATDLMAGIAGVVLTTGGALSYWAIDHCAEKPDFHERRSFLLHLAAPGSL